MNETIFAGERTEPQQRFFVPLDPATFHDPPAAERRFFECATGLLPTVPDVAIETAYNALSPRSPRGFRRVGFERESRVVKRGATGIKATSVVQLRRTVIRRLTRIYAQRTRTRRPAGTRTRTVRSRVVRTRQPARAGADPPGEPDAVAAARFVRGGGSR